jgi:hypothetical protein
LHRSRSRRRGSSTKGAEPAVAPEPGLAELKPERSPVETSSLRVFGQDPHDPDVNSYLVLGVNLVASCTGGHEPAGLLLWLPVERRYGIRDSSHCGIQVFGPEVTWVAAGKIAENWAAPDVLGLLRQLGVLPPADVRPGPPGQVRGQP